MDKHCKGCKYHHNAGHSKESKYAYRYNDWCVKYGRSCIDILGHCKLNNGRVAEWLKASDLKSEGPLRGT